MRHEAVSYSIDVVERENLKRLDGKVALITGGSRGIGKAVAEAYAREGAKVFICARNETGLRSALSDMRQEGATIDGCAGDVGDFEDVERIVALALERYRTIDVLVNNASLLGPRVPIASYPLKEWQDVLRVNLTGVFLMSQQILKVMAPRRQGSIINLSSGVGRIGKPRWGAYAASKFGVEGFTQMLAEELKELDIRVNSVNPGPTRTEMRARAYLHQVPQSLPTADRIVAAFLYLASDETVGITGRSFEAQELSSVPGLESWVSRWRGEKSKF